MAMTGVSIVADTFMGNIVQKSTMHNKFKHKRFIRDVVCFIFKYLLFVLSEMSEKTSEFIPRGYVTELLIEG